MPSHGLSKNYRSFCNVCKQFLTSQKKLLHSIRIRSAFEPGKLQNRCNVLYSSSSSMSTAENEKKILESFAKNLYVANINLDWVFPFPTLANSRDLNAFYESIKPLQEFCVNEEINSAKLDEEAKMPPELIRKLKDLRLFGLVAPQMSGGHGLSQLKLAKVLEEISTLDNSVNMMLASHNLLGVQPLLKYGNQEQKEKYISKLASGEMIAAFCCNEASAGSDINMIQTRAKLSEDGKHWRISGEKTSINNGGIADFMIVFAKIELKDDDDELNDTISAFIVEKSFAGIHIGDPEDKMGMRALNTCDVSFVETPVPVENMLGKEGDGFKIATETLHDARVGLACGIIGPMRKVVDGVTKYADQRVQFGKRIKDFKLVQDKVSRMAENVYAMESVAYLTMGKYDQAFEDDKIPDISVESAIAKVFLAEKAYETVNGSVELCGHRAYTNFFNYERILRDTKMLSLSEGTTDVLKLYIALSCFKYTQLFLKKRTSLYKSGGVPMRLLLFLDNLRNRYGSKKVDDGFLRKRIPSFGLTSVPATNTWLDERLEICGVLFEEIILQLYRKVDAHLQHLGSGLPDEQLQLKKFADITISLYSVIAVMARCNKSLILGLRDQHREYLIAVTFILRTLRHCKLTLNELQSNFGLSKDFQAISAGNDFLEERQYPISHPLGDFPVCWKYFDNVLKTLPK